MFAIKTHILIKNNVYVFKMKIYQIGNVLGEHSPDIHFQSNIIRKYRLDQTRINGFSDMQQKSQHWKLVQSMKTVAE